LHLPAPFATCLIASALPVYLKSTTNTTLLAVPRPLCPQARPLLWVGQRVLEPLQRALADNCHLTRDPLPLIQAAPAFQGGVEARRFSVEGVSLISPHVAGIARRQEWEPASSGSSSGSTVLAA